MTGTCFVVKYFAGLPPSVIIPPSLHTHIHPSVIYAVDWAVDSVLKWNTPDMVLWTVGAALRSSRWLPPCYESKIVCKTAAIILYDVAHNF